MNLKLDVSISKKQISINEISYGMGEGIVSFVNNDNNGIDEYLQQALLDALYTETPLPDDLLYKLKALHPSFQINRFLLDTFYRFAFDFLIWTTEQYNMNKRGRTKADPIDYKKLDYLFVEKDRRFIISESAYDGIRNILLRLDKARFHQVDIAPLLHETYIKESDPELDPESDTESDPKLEIFVAPRPTIYKDNYENLYELMTLLFLEKESFNGLSTMQRYYLYCNDHKPLALSGEFHYIAKIDNKDGVPDDVSEFSGFFKNKKPYLSEQYTIENLTGLLHLETLKMIENNIEINKCENCGKYFLPTKRSDEKYCNNPFKNNRTCRDLGYENKIQSNELLKIYRTEYKTRHARRQRNSNNSPKKAKNDFTEWCKNASELLTDARNGKLTIEEFKKELKEHDNNAKEKA